MSRKVRPVKNRFTKMFLLSALGAIMTLLFVFMGAPFLRVLRNHYGRISYWILGLGFLSALVSSGLAIVGFLVFSIWLTIGLYAEIENKGYANFYTAFVSIAAGSGFLSFVPWAYYNSQGTAVSEVIKQGLQQLLAQSSKTTMLGMIELNVDTIFSQVPSAIVLCQLLSLALALMLDKKIALLMGVPLEKVASQIRLLEFRIPDFLIWPALIAFLFTFMKVEPAWINTVSANAFNVFTGLFFFQGLAVLEVGLIALRSGFFIRTLVYFLLVGQLFFVLSAVGLMDYWMDLRKRIKKIRSSRQNEKNEEHI
jgi:hypothetical protein